MNSDPCCYFCLGEEADEGGTLPLRDCSCRGDSAGFAHFACIVKYAEQKSKEVADKEDFPSHAFSEPWDTCPNCKQPYSNQLSLDLSSAFVSFAETAYGRSPDGDKIQINDEMRVMWAMESQVKGIVQFVGEQQSPDKRGVLDTRALRMECQDVIKKLLSKTNEMKVPQWIHAPETSTECRLYKSLCTFEAVAYNLWSAIVFYEDDRTVESLKTSIAYAEKARDINKSFRCLSDRQSHAIEHLIATATAHLARLEGSDSKMSEAALLNNSKAVYEHQIAALGATSVATINVGLAYAGRLKHEKHDIEAERLITKLLADSRRVHGPEHNVTVCAEKLLDDYKQRYVMCIKSKQMYQALRYESSGELIIKGPVLKPEDKDEEILKVDPKFVVPFWAAMYGCPVMCHGLVGAPQLNGKLGDVRDISSKGKDGEIRLEVHFEDKSLKPSMALIKHVNLKVAFDLPHE